MKPQKMISAAQLAWLNEIGVDTHWLSKADYADKKSRTEKPELVKQPTGSTPIKSKPGNAPVSPDRPVIPVVSKTAVTDKPTAGSAGFKSLPDVAGAENLVELYQIIKKDIDNAGIAAQAVFGMGQADQPRYMLIGEQPGLDDSAAGKPFAGDQATLLTAIFNAVKLPEAESNFKTNLLKYRLPNGAEPDASLIERFLVYLKREIALVRPQNIIALGSVAAGALLNGVKPKNARGQMNFYQPGQGPQIPLWISHQPMALLVHGARKDQAWRDFVAIAKYNGL